MGRGIGSRAIPANAAARSPSPKHFFQMPNSDALIANLGAYLLNIKDAMAQVRSRNFQSAREVVEGKWQVYLLLLTWDALKGFTTLLKSKS